MMPLDEIPSNVQSTKHNATKQADMSGTAQSHARPPPLAIQGMLKSTTELGDVGIFAQRPSRISRSNTQSSLGRHSRSSGTSHARPRQHQRPGLDPQSSYGCGPHASSPRSLQRNDTTRSTMTACQYQSRSRRPRLRPGPYPQQYRPHHYTSHRALTCRRSLVSLRSNSTSAGLPSPHSRAFHPANGLQSVRAPSPALSNMYEYRVPQNYMSRHGSFRTVPSSPGSMASTRRRMQDYRSEHNVSAISFRPFPPAFGSQRYQRRRQPSSQRAVTPASTMPQNYRLGSMTSLDSGPASPTGSIVPFYYDYSESFHGGEALLASPPGHFTIPEVGMEQEEEFGQQDTQGSGTKRQFNILSGSNLGPVELPTKHNRRASEQSRHSRRASNKSVLSVRISSQAIDEGDGRGLVRNLDELETQSEPESLTQSTDKLEQTTGRNSTSSPRNWPEPSASTFFTNASRSPRNLSDLAARAHSPVTAQAVTEVGSIDAIARDAKTSQNCDKQEHETSPASSGQFRLPTLKLRPLSIGMSRPFTSPVSVVHGTAEIISPRPERPTSSQSRKRFSKILDVDQNQEIIGAYSPGHQTLNVLFTKLERVAEDFSPTKPSRETSLHDVSTGKSGKRFGKGVLQGKRPTSTRDRWSGVTSHDKSTVESLLDRHIECLGLRPGDITELNASIRHGEAGHELEHIPELSVPDMSFTVRSSIQEPRPKTADSSHRPTSLTSSAQRRLMPHKLFASVMDTGLPKFPLASSESDARFSLSWSDERARLSCGWLPLPSESNLNVEIGKSEQTLLSGDYADIESGRTVKKFRLRRHSSPSITPKSKLRDLTFPDPTGGGVTQRTPCRRSRSETLPRETSQRRKLRIHLKRQAVQVDTLTSDEWTTTEEKSGHSEQELQKLGLARVPVSVVDGLAELSGESANASEQSLASMLNSPYQQSPGTWSGIVAAMPMPVGKTTGLRRKESHNTVHSHNSKQSVFEPVNNSRRPSREVRTQSSVPQLGQPDLGPLMHVSQFNLSTDYQLKSPHHKKSSFSEPKELLNGSPIKHGRHSVARRRKFDSLRQIMPTSIRSFAFSPQRTVAKQHVVVSQSCRVPDRPSSCLEQASFPETVAMSEFAYRKHKLIEKLKEWCRRRCVQRPFVARKKRSVLPGGFIV